MVNAKQKVEMQVASEQFNRSQQRGYDKLRDEIIGYVKGLSLNNDAVRSRSSRVRPAA